MISSGDAAYGETCLVLVDYDNAFPPNAAFSDQEIALTVETWLRDIATRMPTVARLDVRLYGGWYDESDLSRHGASVVRAMAAMPDFPLRNSDGRILRGIISLASTPLSLPHGPPLLGTYRKRGSLPRIRLSKQPYPDACAQVDDRCPAAILKSFTKHSNRECPVDSCSLNAADAFVIHEQKMVDTMLATDLLIACRDPSTYFAVVVVSGDSDFVPPMLAARTLDGVRLLQLRPRVEEASGYATAVLVDAGIEVI